ncbi:MAG: protein kinase, partial [Elusimicrobiota bacterium]
RRSDPPSQKDGEDQRKTGQEVSDKLSRYIREDDPRSLDAALPGIFKLAASPAGEKAVERLISAMEVQWRKNGGEGMLWALIAESMVRRSPEDETGYRLQARWRAQSEDYPGAVESATRALELKGPDAQLYLLRGGAYEKLRDYDAATQDARESLKLEPGNPMAQALYRLAESRASAPGEGKAAAPMEGVVSVGTGGEARDRASLPSGDAVSDRSRSLALTREAASALAMGDSAGALSKAAAAAGLDPKNAQAFNLKAEAEVALSLSQEAVDDATRAIELAPESPAAFTTRAWAQGKLGLFDKALLDASMAVAFNPSDGAARFTRAFALSGLGRREEMLSELKMAAGLQPVFQESYEAAIRLPADSDSMLLFARMDPSRGAGPAGTPVRERRKVSALGVVIATLVGGFLVAAGLLSVSGRKGRVSPLAEDAEGGGEGFWRRYARVRQIGSGGMGVVYEAFDLHLRRKVAVKRMREELRSDAREKQRFLKEARLAAALKSPNIVEIYSIEEDGGEIYLVLEFVEGRTLEAILEERGRIGAAEARGVFKGVCSALDAAHALSIVHGDIKPANIILSQDGTPKVMDFGLAHLMGDERTVKVSRSWGSPAYMAPEQEDGRICPKSDVYSLGGILYALLTLRP